MDNNPKKNELERNLKPAGSYLDSLSDFADLLGTLGQPKSVKLAEKAKQAEASAQSGKSQQADINDIIKQAEDAAKELHRRCSYSI